MIDLGRKVQPPQRHAKQKPQSGHDAVSIADAHPRLGEVQLESADVLEGGRVGRALKKRREPLAAVDVAPLRVRTELARGHVLDRADFVGGAGWWRRSLRRAAAALRGRSGTDERSASRRWCGRPNRCPDGECAYLQAIERWRTFFHFRHDASLARHFPGTSAWGARKEQSTWPRIPASEEWKISRVRITAFVRRNRFSTSSESRYRSTACSGVILALVGDTKTPWSVLPPQLASVDREGRSIRGLAQMRRSASCRRGPCRLSSIAPQGR